MGRGDKILSLKALSMSRGRRIRWKQTYYRLPYRTMRYQVPDANGCWKDIFLVSEADSKFYSFSESLLQVYDFTNKETENGKR